jgi:hypothetical protein
MIASRVFIVAAFAALLPDCGTALAESGATVPGPAPELGAGAFGFVVAAGVALLLDRRTRKKS